MLSKFSTKTHGKWILCGEHAVLRGHSALVFPALDKTLSFEFVPDAAKNLEIATQYLGQNNPAIHQVIKDIIFQAFELAKINPDSITGNIKISSNIEAGVGMGASAALCVAIAKWLSDAELIADIYSFAKSLENFFHGQSSGLDIVGVGAKSGIYFQNGTFKPINPVWQPNWRLSSCGETSVTAECIVKTQKIWQQNPKHAQQIDQQMQVSTELAMQALQSRATDRFGKLQQAITQAHACFQEWGLISPAMAEHINALKSQGARAIKPTGSGGGGLVVSLWD